VVEEAGLAPVWSLHGARGPFGSELVCETEEYAATCVYGGGTTGAVGEMSEIGSILQQHSMVMEDQLLSGLEIILRKAAKIGVNS
jgi:hypothetical protein